MSAQVELVTCFLKRVWQDGDTDAIYEMFTGETSVRGLEEMAQVGPEDFHAFQRMMTAQFSHIQHHVLRTVEEGEWLALLCSITAVHRETGKPVETQTQIMMRIRDGKFLEVHNQIDLVTLFETTGRLPPRSIDICLAGGKLGLSRG